MHFLFLFSQSGDDLECYFHYFLCHVWFCEVMLVRQLKGQFPHTCQQGQLLEFLIETTTSNKILLEPLVPYNTSKVLFVFLSTFHIIIQKGALGAS
jgi:hypothetical protein